jgi:hypothetical protein
MLGPARNYACELVRMRDGLLPRPVIGANAQGRVKPQVVRTGALAEAAPQPKQPVDGRIGNESDAALLTSVQVAAVSSERGRQRRAPWRRSMPIAVDPQVAAATAPTESVDEPQVMTTVSPEEPGTRPQCTASLGTVRRCAAAFCGCGAGTALGCKRCGTPVCLDCAKMRRAH